MNSLHAPGAAMTFFNVVFISSLIFSVLTLLFRISYIYDTFSDVCTLAFEAMFCIAFGLLCLVASGWMVRFGGNRDGKLVVAAAFGFVASFGYLLDMFFLFQERRNQKKWKTKEVDF